MSRNLERAAWAALCLALTAFAFCAASLFRCAA